MFLEWNTTKSLFSIWQRFSCQFIALWTQIWTGMEILPWFWVGGEILLTYMIFAYHLTYEVSRKMKKRSKNFPMPQLHLLKFYNFFALCGPFWHKNSANWRNLTPKTIKAKKADIRPNVSKLDFWIFTGLRMVSQHTKGSYKVPWSPIGIRFWEMTTPKPKMCLAGQKISTDKKTH